MLTRIEADELKALIDKLTDKTTDKVKDKIEDAYFLLQSHNGLFWGGINTHWVANPAHAIGFPTFIDTQDRAKHETELANCRVISAAQAYALPYDYVLYANATGQYWGGSNTRWTPDPDLATCFDTSIDALAQKHDLITSGDTAWLSEHSRKALPLKLYEGF
jgi:hypothetical protein